MPGTAATTIVDIRSNNGKKIIAAYSIGVLVFAILHNTPIYIPCFFRAITGIPCPGCGLTRAVTLFVQLDFVAAARMNLMFVPLLIGSLVYIGFAIAEMKTKKEYVQQLNFALKKWWVIAFAVVMACASWVYNIVRWIGN